MRWGAGGLAAAVLGAGVALAVPPPAAALPQPCPVFTPPEQVGTLPDVLWFNELSGLVASRTSPGVLWAISDGDNGADVVALQADGTELARYTLTGTTNVDWEDLAIGDGPGGGDHLYVADIGDNDSLRASVTIYRVPEPAAAVDQTPVEDDLAGAEAFSFSYPGGPRDAEALLHDPLSGDLFIATKANDGGKLFRVQLGAPSTVTEVASPAWPLDPSLNLNNQVTGGDISADGTRVLLRSYFRAVLFRRGPGQTVAEAVGGTPCTLPLALEGQGEAIASTGANGGFLTMSERYSAIRPEPNPPHPISSVASCEVPDAGAHGFPDVPGLFDQSVGWLTCTGITTGYPDGTFRAGDGANRAQVAAYLHRFFGRPEVEGPPTFSDVPATHAFAEEIGWLASEGITTGFSDGTFKPQRQVTRAQIAAFLYRAAGEPAVDQPPSFTDVGPGHPFGAAIGWMAEHGLATGFAGGAFRPQQAVSRGALAAFLFRLATTDGAWTAEVPAP